MGTVTEHVDVAVPVRTAYNQWTQFEEFPQFMEGVREVRQVSDTMTHWVTEVGGVRREFDAYITEQRPDQKVAWAWTEGDVKQAGEVTFEALDDSHARVTARMEVEPQGVVEKAGDTLGLIDRRVKGDLKRFKEYIESRGAETGAWRGEVPRPAASSVPPTTPEGYGATTPQQGYDATTPQPGYGTTQPGYDDPGQPRSGEVSDPGYRGEAPRSW